MNRIKHEFKEFQLLLRSVPSYLLVIFTVSVFAMNLLANKSISGLPNWLSLDAGIIVSWFAFLTMDMITKHFGPKASSQISIFTILIVLIFCFFFYLGSVIPGVWGESFTEDGNINEAINNALNQTFGGSWYVLLGSTTAFIASSLVNNFCNWGIGKAFKKNPDGPVSYFLRSYISTSLGQFLDNMIFALIVSHIFFGWTILQCVTCSLTGMAVELLCEIIFSYPGYLLCKKWKKEDLGKEYFAMKNPSEL